MPRRPARPLAPVPRYTLTRREAAASLGISINHFERKVQPDLKVVLQGLQFFRPAGRQLDGISALCVFPGNGHGHIRPGTKNQNGRCHLFKKYFVRR